MYHWVLRCSYWTLVYVIQNFQITGRGLDADVAHTGELLDHSRRLPHRLVLDGPVTLRFLLGHVPAD